VWTTDPAVNELLGGRLAVGTLQVRLLILHHCFSACTNASCLIAHQCTTPGCAYVAYHYTARMMLREEGIDKRKKLGMRGAVPSGSEHFFPCDCALHPCRLWGRISIMTEKLIA
jgi:hypothetical protein